MTDKQRINVEPNHEQVMDADESELAELLSSIERLRAVLYRFAPLFDSDSIEVITRSQAEVEKLSEEISHAFVFQHLQNSRDRLENWDNEGGRIENARV